MNTTDEQLLDVVIVGAGISGISAACYLKNNVRKSGIASSNRESRSGEPGIFFAIPAYGPTVTCTPLVSNLSPGPGPRQFLTDHRSSII